MGDPRPVEQEQPGSQQHTYYRLQPGESYYCGYLMNFAGRTGIHRGGHVLYNVGGGAYAHYKFEPGQGRPKVGEYRVERRCGSTEIRRQSLTKACGTYNRLLPTRQSTPFEMGLP